MCGAPEAQRKADDPKIAFERELAAGSLPDGVGLSIGVVAVSRAAEGLTEAIREADSRMYRDKVETRLDG